MHTDSAKEHDLSGAPATTHSLAVILVSGWLSIALDVLIIADRSRVSTDEFDDNRYPHDDFQPPRWLSAYMKLTLFFLRIVCSTRFQAFITFVILVASIQVGVQTYPALENNSAIGIIDKVAHSSAVETFVWHFGR